MDGALDRMVIDDQIDLVETLLEERRLHVHHGDPIELIQRLRADFLDLDVQDLAHRHVLWTGDGSEGADRRRDAAPSQHRLERHRGGDGVRIRVVLHQNQNPLGPFEMRTDALDARPLNGALDGGLDHVLAQRSQGDGCGPCGRAVIISHHEHRRVQDGFIDSGHDARELSRPCADDQRSASIFSA
jgi:hypothetical protein